MTARILTMGKRLGALAAAERLEAEVFLLDNAPASRKVRDRVAGFAQVDFGDPASCVAAAKRLLGARAPDAVLAVVERAVLPAAAVRQAFGVRGATTNRAHLWRDKLDMKARIRSAGLPCADVRPIRSGTDPSALVGELGLPVVLKPRSASGGRGTVVARDPAEVRAALSDGSIAERFVRGVELSVESLVQGGQVRFENLTEYLRPGWANVVPAALPERIDRAVRRLNRAAIEALEVDDGLTHMEAFVADDDPGREPTVVFGELACRPPGGSLMELMQRAYGFDPWQAHLDLELGRPIAPPSTPKAYSGVWFLHPGAGRVVTVDGLDRARAVPGVSRVECSLEVGQVIPQRVGVGQHTGKILADTASRDDTAAALEEAHSLIQLATDPIAA